MYPIRVRKDEDRPVVFQDMVVLISTHSTYPTQHNFPHLGTQGSEVTLVWCLPFLTPT